MTNPAPLPPLREDLLLTPGPPLDDGSPTWTLHDPVQNRFFRLGWPQFETLKRWSCGQITTLLAQLHQETTLRLTPADVNALNRFLLENALLCPSSATVRDHLAQRAARPPRAWWHTLLHNYLFFRIPFGSPETLLNGLLPWVAPLYSRWFAGLLLLAAGVGLHLVSRQWELFQQTFAHFITWEGGVWFGLALFLIKGLHELGHALTAKRFGIAVPTMGVAFIVLMPVLYTDLTDAWRLANRRQRLAIVGAGVVVELGLAALATLAWSFVADGPARAFLFFLATAGWTTSLLVNLNPLMRFDGYFLLSDYWNLPNLQERGFALARWHLRRVVLGLDALAPEALPAKRMTQLLLYAYATWIYRLLLFTGIALFVYHLTFKVLGLLLFAVELGVFVLAPIGRELAHWHRMRHAMHWNRTNLFLTLLTVTGLALLFIPWNHRIAIPAVIKAGAETRLHAPAPAVVESIAVRLGQQVRKGAPLFVFQAPALRFQEQEARRAIRTLELELTRQLGNPTLINQSAVTRSELAKALTTLRGLEERQSQLTVTAPISGEMSALTDGLEPGHWVENGAALGEIVDRTSARLLGYVTEERLSQLHDQAPCLFVANDRTIAPLPCTVLEIDPFAAPYLAEPTLATQHGGAIDTETSPDGHLVSRQAIYRVNMRPSALQAPQRATPGLAWVEGEPQSIMVGLWRRVQSILLRESGF